MTNGEKILLAYPKNAGLILQQIGAENWSRVEPSSAPTIIASYLDWFESPEGWEFWNRLYERGRD